MFSVEQLLANDTFDRMQAMATDLCRVTSNPVVSAFPHSRNALGCRGGGFVSTSISLASHEVQWWSVEHRLAFNLCLSIVSGAIAEHRMFPRISCPTLPSEVTQMFNWYEEDVALPLPLFPGHTKLGALHQYTFDGHAALCMWLTDSVSFPGVTRPDAFTSLRWALSTLTSVWSLAAAQQAATRDTSDDPIVVKEV